MMTCYCMCYEWFKEIADRVPHGIPYAYVDEDWNNVMIEVDVDEETFIKVSKTTKWMY